MKSEECTFYSDGVRLDGLVLIPDGLKPGEKRAAVVLNSGMNGIKEWVPSRFWPQFLEAGYVCMAFDYRGFGTSDGPRGRMLPDEEKEDIEAAITFLQQHPAVDPDRIGILGWGLGGAVVIAVAAEDERVKATCCANGFGWGGRTVRDACTLEQWIQRQDEIATDRVNRVLTGKSAMVAARQLVAPGQVGYRANSQYSRDLAELKRPDVSEFTLASAEAYYKFRPELVVDRISPRAFLIVHGTRETFYSVDEATSLYERAKEPKDLLWVEGGEHLDWIRPESPLSKPGVGRIVNWFREQLPPTVSTTARAQRVLAHA